MLILLILRTLSQNLLKRPFHLLMRAKPTNVSDRCPVSYIARNFTCAAVWDEFMGGISISKAGQVQVLPVEGLSDLAAVQIDRTGSQETGSSEETLVNEEMKWVPRTYEELTTWMSAQEDIVEAVLSLPDGIYEQLEENSRIREAESVST